VLISSSSLRDDDCVLVDAGGEYHGYTADISRTWPISGKFTDGQRAAYEAVSSRSRVAVVNCVGAGHPRGLHRIDEKEGHVPL
jgi:Xaa-Pro aminopeptidase